MKNTRHPGNVRRKNRAIIFEAAKLEFVTHGFKGASIKRIAERAKLARSNIHYYFSDKADLYRQLLNNIIATWNTHYDTLDENAHPRKALTDYIRAKVMFSKEDPMASRIFASEIIHGAPLIHDYLSGEFKNWVGHKVEVIEKWQQQGLIDPLNPYHLLFLIWGSTQHYADFYVQVLAAMNRERLDDDDYEAIVSSLTTIVLKGCGIQ